MNLTLKEKKKGKNRACSLSNRSEILSRGEKLELVVVKYAELFCKCSVYASSV